MAQNRVFVYVILIVIGLCANECASKFFKNHEGKNFQHPVEKVIMGKALDKLTKDLDLLMGNDVDQDWPDERINKFCTSCAIAINRILEMNDTDLIGSMALSFCVELGLGTQFVCEGLVNPNKDILFYIMAAKPDLTGKDVCGVAFSTRGCVSDNPERVWEVTLPPVPKPPVDLVPYPQTDVPIMKILHLSDTHYDPDYLPGGTVDCAEKYLCCRYTVENQDPADTAGFWGTYGNCDVPKWTLEALYDHIARTHTDLDFIIWTGDIVPHDVWNTSKASNIEILHEMSDLLIQYFPGIPVYATVGNHEGDPVNQFSQPYITEPEFEMSWLYDELSSIWQTWLPAEAGATISYAAFYSVEVKPGLKLISLNTNFCSSGNWWLILDSTDIANHLDLLAKELQKAEDAGDKVYIIGHIPSGTGDCSLTWSHQFNRIVSRYESTISSIFYGHTHNDEYKLFFDTENMDRVCEISYIGQGQTTYSVSNPAYKIYTVEGNFTGSQFRVLDHENWVFELDVSNFRNASSIVRLYSAKEEYGLTDLSPQSLFDLVMEMNTPNSTKFDKYFRNQVKATPARVIKGCDEECKENMLCGILTTDTSDHSKCNELIKNSTEILYFF